MATTPNTCLENISEFVQQQGHGVKGLADMGIKSLPTQYIQPEERRFNKNKVITVTSSHDLSIPVVDVSNLDDPSVEKQICDAAEKWGFLQIINHGVPLDVLENEKAATHRFFELPAEEKAKYLEKNAPPSKTVKYGSSFSPEFERVFEWKDNLTFLFVSEDEALAHWPPACRDEALAYLKSTESLIRNLIKVLMRGLEINEIDERKKSQLMGSMRMNLNYYPKCRNPELTFGVSHHSDVSILTVLLQDDIGGLYVRRFNDDNNDDNDEHWVHVQPINGALVVNIGDALQILSNGKYRSVEHLVTANGTKNRVSIPIFVNPCSDSIIAPLQEIMDRGEKPLYKSIVFLDYFKYFFGKPHDGKATINFVKIS